MFRQNSKLFLFFVFSVVTPSSYLRFRVLDHSSFRKDTVVGHIKIGLQTLLHYYNGKLENLELTLELHPEKNYPSFVPITVGKLIVCLNGLNLNSQTDLPAHYFRPSKLSSSFTLIRVYILY